MIANFENISLFLTLSKLILSIALIFPGQGRPPSGLEKIMENRLAEEQSAVERQKSKFTQRIILETSMIGKQEMICMKIKL